MVSARGWGVVSSKPATSTGYRETCLPTPGHVKSLEGQGRPHTPT